MHRLNKIIAAVGLIATACTVFLLRALKNKIVEAPTSSPRKENEQSQGESILSQAKAFLKKYRILIATLVGWGSILGINWTYGSLFGIIFKDHNLSEKEMALIGLAANVSTAFMSNLGTWIHNKFKISTMTVIAVLNVVGLVSAVFIEASKYLPSLQNLWILIVFIILMRAGYSSFVSLAFMIFEKSRVSSVIISGIFFWIANCTNLIMMEVVDFSTSDVSLFLLTVSVALCIFYVHQAYDEEGLEQSGKFLKAEEFETLEEVSGTIA